MNELLGFIVLSGPLFWVLIFFLFAIVLAVVFMKKVTGAWKKLFTFVSVLGVVFIILFGDEIVGRKYLEYLCENKTEWEIHEQIKLPPEYWNDDSLRFPVLKNGMANFKKFRKFYNVEDVKNPYINFILHIDETKRIFFDAKTKQKAATKIYFSRKYGWLNEFSPAPNGGEICINVLIRKYGKNNYYEMRNRQSQKFMNQLFKK